MEQENAEQSCFDKAFRIINLIIRIVVIVWLGMLVKGVTYDYRCLSDTAVLAILLIVVLVLADSFTSFSIGSIFTLKKEVAQSKKEVEKLRDSVLNIAVNNSNKNTNTISVQHTYRNSSDAEKKRAEKETEFQIELKNTPHAKTQSAKPLTPGKIDYAKIEKDCLKKYCDQNSLLSDELQLERRVQFPQDNRSFVCDACYKRNGIDIFLEIKRLANFMEDDRVVARYLALLKQYNQNGVTKACLHLLLVVFPEDEHAEQKIERLRTAFYEAISFGLMEIKPIYFSKEDMSQ